MAAIDDGAGVGNDCYEFFLFHISKLKTRYSLEEYYSSVQGKTTMTMTL